VTVYRRARPDLGATPPVHLMGAAVTGRFPRLGRGKAAKAAKAAKADKADKADKATSTQP
jgi:hypothetical protein